MDVVVANPAAMAAVAASETAMTAVVSSQSAMAAVVASTTAASAVATAIQSCRAALITMLSSATNFSKSFKIVGSGSGEWTDGLNAANIYIPTICNDDNDTDYTVYYQSTTQSILYVAKHSGEQAVSSGVSLRGVKVVGTGNSNGNVSFDVYTLK